MPFVDANGARIHYRVDGPANGKPLLLSHSIGTDLRLWDGQLGGALARRHRLVRYDARGHGASPVAAGPCTVATLARDALAVLDALGIARASFCGLSLGGATGMRLAVDAPERLEKLVLCNTGALLGTPDLWNARIDAVRRSGTAGFAESVMSRWFTARFLSERPQEAARAREMLLATPAEGYAACAAALRDHDERAAVSRIGAPTLLVAGAHDAATPPSDLRFLEGRIAGARYVELDAAHLSNIEAREAFDEAVAAFLEE
jgi:3-oxoadipate enol-lactonase